MRYGLSRIVASARCATVMGFAIGAAVTLSSCSRAPERTVVDSRLLPLVARADAAVGALGAADGLVLRSMWQAPIDGEDALGAWAFYVPDGRARLATGGGIDLGPLASSTYLVWNGRVQASRVDLLRLTFAGPLPGAVELYWNGAGEDFGPDRYVLANPVAGDAQVAEFAVGDQPAWKGTVTRIGIRLAQVAPDAPPLVALEGLRALAGPALRTGDARRVSLSGRTLRAWVARPASRMERTVTLPRAARLRVDAAALLSGGGGIGLRILLREEPRAGHVLLDTVLEPPPDEPERWKRFEVDLAEWSGRTVDLVFETAAAPEGSLVLWGEPRLLGRRRDARPNVILLSLDTVRAGHLSLYGYERPTTPALDAFAARWGTTFETAVASAPWTLPSHVAMLSGVDAVRHGVNGQGPIPPSVRLVQQSFRDGGYATYATTAAVLLTPEMGFSRGFDEFDVSGEMVSSIEWDREVEQGISRLLRWLENHRSERFFAFFHTYEAHVPHQVRQPWYGQFGGPAKQPNAGAAIWMSPDNKLFLAPRYGDGVQHAQRDLSAADRELVTVAYDSGLAHLDHQLSRLFAFLEHEQLLEETVVVVTSDHGEAFYEHGLVGHVSLYDHDLLVPLVLAAPGRSRGRRVAAQVRSVDIVPTLLELAGLPALPDIDGESLAPHLADERVPGREAWSYALSTFRGVSLRSADGNSKAIAADSVLEPYRGSTEVYHLRRDPGETRAVAADPDLRRSLLERIEGGASALEIRFRNRSRGSLEGTIDGLAGEVLWKATSQDLEDPCCAETPGALGLEVRVAAGRSFTMVFQDVPAGELRLRFAMEGVACEMKVDTRDPGRARALVWQHGSCAPSPVGDRPGTASVEVRRAPAYTAPAKEQEAARQRLRALGYIQ